MYEESERKPLLLSYARAHASLTSIQATSRSSAAREAARAAQTELENLFRADLRRLLSAGTPKLEALVAELSAVVDRLANRQISEWAGVASRAVDKITEIISD